MNEICITPIINEKFHKFNYIITYIQKESWPINWEIIYVNNTKISTKIIPSATHQQETKMTKNSYKNIYSISLATWGIKKEVTLTRIPKMFWQYQVSKNIWIKSNAHLLTMAMEIKRKTFWNLIIKLTTHALKCIHFSPTFQPFRMVIVACAYRNLGRKRYELIQFDSIQQL